MLEHIAPEPTGPLIKSPVEELPQDIHQEKPSQIITDHGVSCCFGTSLAPRLLLLFLLTALDFGCFGRCSLSPTSLTKTLVHHNYCIRVWL